MEFFTTLRSALVKGAPLPLPTGVPYARARLWRETLYKLGLGLPIGFAETGTELKTQTPVSSCDCKPLDTLHSFF